uniref:Uncharacterized protein n=1 Tax=Candidatus Methanogaster sp. ANME-2c ERB4 TaxID=2759911 RepID=A0A7G9YI82_9EURY|nr:hypothetical protein LDJELIEA_00014 [Methanosarcinales archaeon ANME-2c ERB4]
MERFPKHFIDAILSKECILFIGSGISMWSGLPGWGRLIEQMVEFLSDRRLQAEEKSEINQILSRGDLLTAASLCAPLMRKGNFRDFIDEVFIDPNPKPHEIHRIIVDLGPDSFITTNYDRLIDSAYQMVHDGLVLSPVNNDQPIEQARILKHGASRFIFAPHGRVEKCGTIVLTREDYRGLKYNSKATIQTLQHLLISRPVVYLGFGLQDPDFLMIKDEIAATYQGGERDHFAIMPDVSDLQKDFWNEQYGINILSYKTKEIEVTGDGGCKKIYQNHDELLLLLQDLRRTLKERSTIKTVVSTAKEPTPSFAVQIRSSLIRYCEDIVYKFSVRRSNGFALTAIFRKELSPDTEPGGDYGKQPSPFTRTKNMPVLELLNSYNNLILIGSPGAGKTHAVTTYAAILAESTLNMLRSTSEPKDANIVHSIPLILPMKEYTGDIKEMIASRLPRSVDADRALEYGCLVLIFDAVNEVSRDLVDTKVLANNISWIVSRFPRNKFIFTSRSMNYVSFLKPSVFELQPISLEAIDHYLEARCSISLNSLSDSIIEMLTNPLFLTLFVQANKEGRSKISNADNLLREYFSTIEQKLIQETELADLPLIKLLTPIAYRMIDQGSQTVLPDHILAHFHSIFRDYSQLGSNAASEIFQTLISLGVLVPDAEGKIGLFHQTALEYLAAVELVSLYHNDPLVLEEKLDLFRWDETIILFISLLSPEQSKAVLSQIAETDIVFACRAFESATIQEQNIGLQLSDIISEKLANALLSNAEKHSIAQAIHHIGPYGRKAMLLRLLDDPVMAGESAISLARMGVKGAVPKITELLLNDNVWPSDFAQSLELLADESMIPQLIKYGNEVEEEGLADSNLAEILSNFESNELYTEISKLVQSEVAKERQFAAEILKKIDSDRARECLAQMLYDSDAGVRWGAIFGLGGAFDRRPYESTAIVSQMFELLANEESGEWAAGYLRGLTDDAITKEAASRLQSPRNEYDRINLCAVIAKSDPETSKRTLFDALDNYNPAFHKPLYNAIASLSKDYIIPEIFAYLETDDVKLRLTVLETLRWTLGHDEQLHISKEDCEHIITLWENSDDYMGKNIAGCLLTDNFSAVSKGMLLKRFSDATYPFREQLIEFVARLPLVKGDLSMDVIEWLVTRLGYDGETHPVYSWNPAARILGMVCDEGTLKEKLIPLLNSSNEVLRSNAYIAVSEAERILGKRFIRK